MSRFRAEDASGRGAGGKAPRIRRLEASGPYLRRSPPPPPQPEARGWLSGIVSGAGKLIASVLGSDSSDSGNSSCSCSGSESGDGFDQEYGYASDIDGDLDLHEKELELVEDGTTDYIPLTSVGESKLLIEQLIQQEVFTRNECNKLIEMVQSRVVDYPVSNESFLPQSKLPSRILRGNVTSTKPMGLDWSCEQNWKSPVAGSHMYCSDHGHLHELCDTTVMEAKKWIQEKRSAFNSKEDVIYGTCTLNTEVYRYDTESDGGSPVELAKSYMRVLPPWQSPRMTTPSSSTPSVVMHEKYDSLDPVNPTFSSLRPINGDHLRGGIWGTLSPTLNMQPPAMYNMTLSPLPRESVFPDGKNIANIPTSSRDDGQNSEMLINRTRDSYVSPTQNLVNAPVEVPTNDTEDVSINGESNIVMDSALDNGLVKESGFPTSDYVEISGEEISNGVKVACSTNEKFGTTATTSLDAALMDTSYVMDAEPISVVHVSSNALFTSFSGEDAHPIMEGGIASAPRSIELERFSSQPEAVDVHYCDNMHIHKGDGCTQNGVSSIDLRSLNPPCCAGDTDANGGDDDAKRLDIGTTLKSIKKMLRNNRSNPANAREKKAAAKTWRGGRGRGRGGRKRKIT